MIPFTVDFGIRFIPPGNPPALPGETYLKGRTCRVRYLVPWNSSTDTQLGGAVSSKGKVSNPLAIRHMRRMCDIWRISLTVFPLPENYRSYISC